MTSSGDAGGKVITASCTLLAASQMSDACPSSPGSVQLITLRTSSQKIVVPVAAVCASPDKQSSLPSTDDGRLDCVSSTKAASLITGASEKQTEATTAADTVSHKPAAQKTGSVNVVTRRVRFQAKPNISKNARTR